MKEKLQYQSIILILAILTATFLSGCNKKEIRSGSKFNVISLSIEKIFDIQLPATVDSVTAYQGGWQDKSFSVYFEMPSDCLNQMKTDKITWEEIPTEYRAMISKDYVQSPQLQNDRWREVIIRSSNYVNALNLRYQIDNIMSGKVQWYYYSPTGKTTRAEDTIVILISENQNGVVGCFFSNGDTSDYDGLEELYRVLSPEKSITFYKK